MPIVYVAGDIFNVAATALINPVNCVGVMGKGLALAFKQRFPRNYIEYVTACHDGLVRPGRPYVYETPDRRVIINFPTKRHWRDPSRLADIVLGLTQLPDIIREFAIISVAMPRLGCGLGGLSWQDVKPLVEAFADVVPGVRVVLVTP